MEPVGYVFCLLLGVALPMAAFFVLSRRVLWQLAVASSYRQAARQLQLEADTRGTSIHGHVDDRRLWVGEVMTAYGRSRDSEVRGVIDLKRPLGLGLYVHLRGTKGSWFQRARSPEQDTGDPELDRRLRVHADDAQRVRTLLLHPRVRSSLEQLASRSMGVELTDGDVRVILGSHVATPAGILGLVSELRGLAEALEEARMEVGPAPEAAVWLEPWSKLAQELDLQLEPWLPAMSGRYQDRRVVVALGRDQEGHQAQLRLWFHAHPPLGLRLTPQHQPDGYWSVGQDIQVGHTRFDTAFVIKAWDPALLVQRLADGARAQLLTLADQGWLEVDDRGLDLRGLPPEPEAVQEALKQCVAVARALGW